MATAEIVPAMPEIEIEPSERERAERTREVLESELGRMRERQVAQEHSAMVVGRYLRDVSQNGWYRLYGYQRFGDYLQWIIDTFHRERSTVYGWIGAAKQLDAYVNDSDLDQIGIEKAKLMAKAARASGRIITPEIITLAKNPKSRIADVRAHLEREKMIDKGEKPRGSWFDFGCFLSTDERQEVNLFFDLGKRLLEVGKDEPEWSQKKKCFLAAVREFLATYGVAEKSI